MELSRRNVLKYGAVTGAGLMLPRFSRRPGKKGVVLPNLTPPLAVHTYEEGVDGTAVQTVDGVITVMGAPMYSAANAAHGGMGWLSSSSVGGGRIMYANPASGASSGSIYLTPLQITTGATATAVAFWSALDSPIPTAQLRLTSDGRLEVTDSSGTRQGLSGRQWTPQQRVRLDWRQLWDGSTFAVSAWVYVGGNVEGWRADGSVQAAFLADTPSFVSLGQENNSQASVGFDTYREYDAATVPAPYDPVIGVNAIHSYDDGVDGQTVLVGDDMVVSVTGSPKYAANGALHGAMGVVVPSSGGGVLRYDTPYPPGHTGSLYARVVTRGGSDSRIVAFQSGPTVLAQLKLSQHGQLQLADAAGRTLAQSSSKAKLGRWARIDWQAVWDGTTLGIDARYFATDPESPDNYTEVTGGVPASSTPDTIAAGTAAAGWRIAFDTLRTYGDVSAWPDPFQPTEQVRPAGMAAWAGDATQTTVEISAYTNGTTSVGLAVSTSPDMSDPTNWPSSPPNEYGWNKWSVTGLSPDTRYYHQFTDTPDGGDPTFIGQVSTFRTLRPEGVECTMRIAFGSCGQNNPTNTAAFDDIAAWAPDRTVHLGDFAYPNNLTRDPRPHMYNWALNATDAGITKVMAVGCMDYIISDHDDNGTGNSNIPTFNDPITMTSIASWQQVVPARMEDTENPPHGRWRSEVEGNVRIVKLDTRSIDKSDTSSMPTDPRSPDSTMLGATQLQWLKDQIDAAVAAHQLIILLSDCAWNGVSPGPPIPVTFSDKWPSYIYERDLVSDYAAAAGAQMFIVFGDSHGLQQDDGTHEKNGFASICCGPLDQELHMHYQDAYQFNYPSGILEQGGPYRHGQQYQRLTVSQDAGSPVITVTAEARDCSPVVDGTPMTVNTLTKVYTV